MTNRPLTELTRCHPNQVERCQHIIEFDRNLDQARENEGRGAGGKTPSDKQHYWQIVLSMNVFDSIPEIPAFRESSKPIESSNLALPLIYISGPFCQSTRSPPDS